MIKRGFVSRAFSTNASRLRGKLISTPTASATARIFDAKNISSTTAIITPLMIIPPLTDSEKLEVGENSNHQPSISKSDKLVIASYNIRYARGPYLISGGVRRKLKLMGRSRRPQHIGQMISAAARAFTEGNLLPCVDVLAL